MVKKAKFEPIGDVLSPESAFVQACTALDVAAIMAIKQDDVEGLTNVAAVYIELAARMMGGAPEEETYESRAPLGFAPSVFVPENPEEVELEDE